MEDAIFNSSCSSGRGLVRCRTELAASIWTAVPLLALLLYCCAPARAIELGNLNGVPGSTGPGARHDSASAIATAPAAKMMAPASGSGNDDSFEGTQQFLRSQLISFPPIPGPVTYGTPPVELAAQASSGLAVSFRIVSGPGILKGNSLAITGVGTLLVIANQIGDSNYAPAAPVIRSLTVEPALLTVKALNLYMMPGAPVPPLVYRIWGLVNGDTQSSATTGQPLLTTTVTSRSKVGAYNIAATVGTLAAWNYTFTAVDGTLTVTDRVVSFMGDSQTHGSIHGNCEHSWPKPGVPPCWTNLVQEQMGWNFDKDISQDGNRWAEQIKLMFQTTTGGPLLYRPDAVTIAGLGQNDADDFSSIHINCVQNPRAGDTLTLNGAPVTFVTSPGSGNRVAIGATPGQTCMNLQKFACPDFTESGCGSSDENIAQSFYSNETDNGATSIGMQPVVPGYVQTLATSNPAAFTFQQLATPDQIASAIQTQAEAAAILLTAQPASEAEGGIASLIPGQSMTVSGAPCENDDGGTWGRGYFTTCGNASALSFTAQGSAVYVVYESGSGLDSTFTVSVTAEGVTTTSPPIGTAMVGYGSGYIGVATYRMATPSATEVSEVTINFLAGSTRIGYGATNGNTLPVSGRSWFALWETFDAVNNLGSVYAAIRLGERRAVQQLDADNMPVIDVPVGESFNCQQNAALCTSDGQHPSTAAMQTFANYFLTALSSIE